MSLARMFSTHKMKKNQEEEFALPDNLARAFRITQDPRDVIGRGNDPASGAFLAPSFELNFADLGAGRVDLTPKYTSASVTPSFTRASTAYTVNSAGILTQVASGVARSYYDPTTLEYLGYLVEGARTNLCLQSEDFATTWTNTNSTESVNATTAPDGTATADELIDDATNDRHMIEQPIVVVTATSYTMSIFAKANTLSWIYLLENSGVSATAYFNLSTGVVGTVSGTGSPSATIKAYPNGWYRCTMTFTSSGISAGFRIGITTGDAVPTYSGSGQSVYLWGAQFEAGAFASSYIPTTTVAVTRNADVLTYSTSGWLNASAGTLYADTTPLLTNAQIAAINWFPVCADDGTTNESMLFAQTSGNGRFVVIDGGALVADVSAVAFAQGVSSKLAAAWQSNSAILGHNGSLSSEDTSVTLPTVTTLSVGVRSADSIGFIFGPIRRVAYYNRRRPNAYLQALTA